jgi:hypothetical protein
MLLSACANSNLGETESTTPSTLQTQTTTITTQPTEPPIPTPAEVIDGTYSVIDENKSERQPDAKIETFFCWNWHKENYESSSVKILHTTEAGEENTNYISYNADRKNFTFTVNGVGHTYDYLIYTPVAGQPEDDFDYLHILLVSDNPDATYLDTLDKENPTAVIVYARFVTLDKSLDSYGDIPTIVKQDGVDLREIGYTTYLKDSYFMEDHFTDAQPKIMNEASTVYRFDYDGNLLCSVELPGYYPDLNYAELSDGGFLMSTKYYENNEDKHILARYDADGKQLWTHDFSAAAVVDFHVVDDVIYCFGRSDNRDITATTLSLDGEILSEKIILNGNYHFLHVIPEEDGFKIYARPAYAGATGDILYDQFYVLFDFDLAIVGYEETDSTTHYGSQPKGYLNNKPIFDKDPIFNYHTNETFPENVSGKDENVINPSQIFAYQDGYIIVRTHRMDWCSFTQRDNFPFYFESIFTYYDSEGVPQWQYVSPIYLA